MFSRMRTLSVLGWCGAAVGLSLVAASERTPTSQVATVGSLILASAIALVALLSFERWREKEKGVWIP